MSAVKHGEFSETLIAYHPGVTTMWLAGLRTFFIKPRVNVENLAQARLFIGAAVYFGIGITCFLIYQLFGRWVCLTGFTCLVYSPFFLSQTRRVHTDALASTFILLTVLLFLCYCQNRQRHRLQVVPVLRLHPYYATYHFPLLSGEWITKNSSVGGGVGLDVAAAYLNAKPGAQHLHVRVSRFSNNLKKYFVGKTWQRGKMEILPHGINFDYDVEYVRDIQIRGTPLDAAPEKSTPSSVLQLSSDLNRELEHVVQLNGVDYVWIYSVFDKRSNAVPMEK